jgi:hypothetical protein
MPSAVWRHSPSDTRQHHPRAGGTDVNDQTEADDRVALDRDDTDGRSRWLRGRRDGAGCYRVSGHRPERQVVDVEEGGDLAQDVQHAS